jgi:outer membrane immunogenic protein
MRGLLLATIAFAMLPLADSAGAAGMPVKAPAAAPLPIWTWTGFYVGGNVGYSIARDPGGFESLVLAPGNAPTPERFNFSPAGTVGGAQLGWNWQVLPNWVLGIEADLQATSQSDAFTCIQQCLNVPRVPELNGTTVNQHLRWFDTVRGRVGWANGPTLWYLTGGLAVGQVRTSISTIQEFSFVQNLLTFNDTKTGWAFGGGLEFQVYGNWTARAEYLYMDLGSIAHSFLYTAPGLPSTNNIYNSAVRDHIVRAAVNYKFDWGDAAVAAAPVAPASSVFYKASPALPAAAWNWTGVYAGGNVGYGVARDPTTKVGIFDTTLNPILDEAFYLMPQGIIGGGQVGYNWQWSNIVLGVEADLQSSHQHDNQTCATFCDSTAGSSIALVGQRLPWFGTLRARAGWTTGPTLLYATGGAARGKVTTTITQSDFNGVPLSLKQFEFDNVSNGWTIGGGLENRLVGDWTAKVEYLYIDLGSFSGTYVNPPPPSAFATTHTVGSSTHDHVIRVGLNYKFDHIPFIY